MGAPDSGADGGTGISAARVYDYLTKGPEACARGECYALPQDRALARRLLEIDPGAGERARANRRFLASAARDAAKAGIGQALDLGAGLPADPSVDRAMREVNPDARIAYVDSDPVAVPAWTSARRGDAGVSALRADITDPGGVLSSAPLDFSRPVAVILGSVLQILASPHEVLDAYKAVVVPGSRFIVSAICYTSPALRVRTEEEAGRAVRSTSRDDLEALLYGLRILPPGIAEARFGIRWMPRRPGAVMLTVTAVKDLGIGNGTQVTFGCHRRCGILGSLVSPAPLVDGPVAGEGVAEGFEGFA